MHIGIFGGSFDPPHVGHVMIAQDAMSALALDQLLVIPAGSQPLKPDVRTSAAHRLVMVQRSFDGLPDVVVDPLEIDRGGLSFMVDTVEQIRRREPTAELHLLVGEDVIATLPRWRDVNRLMAMVHLVVLTRDSGTTSGSDTGTPLVAGDKPVRRLATRRVDVSSTEIRARVRDGRSIRGFVADAVAEYIASTGLYTENSRESVAVDLPARA